MESLILEIPRTTVGHAVMFCTTSNLTDTPSLAHCEGQQRTHGQELLLASSLV